MHIRSLIAALVAIATTAAAGDNYLVYFGTYTGAKTGSKGIYVSKFNAATGELGAPEIAAETGSPSFLEIHPSKKFIYAVGEMGTPTAKGGGVTSFTVSLPSGKLTQINQVSAVGQGPCHVNIDKAGKLAMVANYGSGSCASYAIKDDGSLSEAASFHQHQGSGPNKGRQAGPHAHSANFSPDNQFAFVCDLGLDRVKIYKIDPATGKTEPHGEGVVAAGSGPRHFAFHPNGKFAFVNNEMGMSETTFAYDAGKGALSEVSTASTIPEADRSQKGLSTAETRVHPNGRFVYVSNRGHNTIAVFSCDAATGKLTRLENVNCEGKTPRNFNLDPSGKWLIVAHQDGNSVALFKVDSETGKLTFTGKKLEVGGPCCVRFLAVE